LKDIEMRFEPLELTPELLMNGLTLWNTPIQGVATGARARIEEFFELSWSALNPTVGVSEISVSVEPVTLPVAGQPPERTWARVSIFGFGWKPGTPVITKWNNAFGFPDNGEGNNSIKLQEPVPDSNGRFAFQVIHRGVLRAAAEWQWEGNKQIVIDARQGSAGSPDFRHAYQRYIPPHVLWQWIPYNPVLTQ